MQANFDDNVQRFLSYARGYDIAIEAYESRLLPDPIESLCSEPESGFAAIFDFFGLDFRPEYLAFSSHTSSTVIRCPRNTCTLTAAYCQMPCASAYSMPPPTFPSGTSTGESRLPDQRASPCPQQQLAISNCSASTEPPPRRDGGRASVYLNLFNHRMGRGAGRRTISKISLATGSRFLQQRGASSSCSGLSMWPCAQGQSSMT